MKCQNDNTPLLDIISRELLVSLDIESVAKIVDALKKMTATSLKEIILAIETFKNDISRYLHEKKSKILIDKAVDSIVGIENFSMDNLVEIVKQEIFQEDVTAVEQIETLLNLDKEIFYRWYQYINRNYEEDIIYHTFHSTKGLEYDNVVMVFGDSFGRSKG